MKKLAPQQALNKAFLKVKPTRAEIERFKTALVSLLNHLNPAESEEFHKNLLADFLKQTYYAPAHFINTKGHADLVIHAGKDATSAVGVIIEAKRPANAAEMPKPDQLDSKALRELVLYYLRERVAGKNLELRHVIVTNALEWFLFDAAVFEKAFAQNAPLVTHFTEFEAGRLSGTTTDFFYEELAKPAIAARLDDLTFTHFNLRDYDAALRNSSAADDAALIALFKLLSPEHLLKLPFANDSNTLDKGFYAELLHIIGLAETKDGNKKVIRRNAAGERHPAALIENAIARLESQDKLSNLTNPDQFGETLEERLFNVALELTITWMNRVLFLKLLEAQLLAYHKGDPAQAFLNSARVKNFDALEELFFDVLARQPEERAPQVKQAFANVPYLNSSLFEPTELEKATLNISSLNKNYTLPLHPATVLKDSNGKRRAGSLPTLEYLFAFLDAYDFASDGGEGIQEDNKSLINASVLGLIFEKINGYKDGSFFTPGFITMYMCRETLRRAVVQKFNERKGWQCAGFDELYDKIEDRAEANEIINSLKICDPAVGSGHFLVSALNELIAIKSDLRILQDRHGQRLKEYHVEVVNDELIVTDDDGDLFEYRPASPESRRAQEALFHEKQTIIERCLFGVDINPNSVKICRLRLWIELLKHAYYKADGALETLPNIDINIKEGNSLISRFAFNADLNVVLSKQKRSIAEYQQAVQAYRAARRKDEKRKIENLIAEIKQDFRREFNDNEPHVKRLKKISAELIILQTQGGLFELSAKEQKARQKQEDALQAEIAELTAYIEDMKQNKIYRNAFEWRFEFPEVLNDNGDFVGFDVVIGNPPYGVHFTTDEKAYYKEQYSIIHVRTPESFNYFIYRAKSILKCSSFCSLIIPSSLLNQAEFEKTREFILKNSNLFLDINLGDNVFDDVVTPTCIIGFHNSFITIPIVYADLSKIERDALFEAMNSINKRIQQADLIQNQSCSFVYKQYQEVINKCYKNRLTLKDVAEEVATGISSGFDTAYIFTDDEIQKKDFERDLFKKLVIGGEINRYFLKPVSTKKIMYIIDDVMLESYPKIYNELLRHKEQLTKRREAVNGKIKWYSLNWPRRKKLFELPKILIRQTANKILAAYDEEQWYCLKSGLIIQLPERCDISYFYLLGLLNSRVIDFLYRDLVNEDVRIFPEVKPIQLFKLPIEKGDSMSREKIEGLVKEIIHSKQRDPAADTRALETEIDRLVYALYGLTAEEIEIVEGTSK